MNVGLRFESAKHNSSSLIHCFWQVAERIVICAAKTPTEKSSPEINKFSSIIFEKSYLCATKSGRRKLNILIENCRGFDLKITMSANKVSWISI